MDHTDQELITSYLKGDEKSFDLIVTKYSKSIYNFIRRLTGNQDESSDITQEVFLKVWKNLKKYNLEQNFKTWIYTIARNSAIDFMRKKKLYVFSDLENPNDDESFADKIVDNSPLPNELFEKKEAKIMIEKELEKLSTDQKTVILLHSIEDMSFEEVGMVLGKPLNTVKSHYRRGLEALRKNLVTAPN